MRPAINLGLILSLALTASLRAVEPQPSLGANSCSSSGCHGGAGDRRDEYVTWSQHDVHSRSFATLTTARAARMAEALSIPNPSASARCVVCHAPLAAAEPSTLGEGVDPSEGVSCVSCHDIPAGWIRGHTRSDWSHADRVAAGMRDLNDLYTRANTCVACHQNLEPTLVTVGHHPALIFEMDGQTQDEPRHWKDLSPDTGAQAWFVGQAVALREESWALLNGRPDAARAKPAWEALAWLLSRSGLAFSAPAIDTASATSASFASAVASADLLARRAAQDWKPGYGREALRRLSATQADFLAQAPQFELACRADRLVLALDRLLASIPPSERPAGASASLDRLFRLAQSQPDFAPADFAAELARFAQAFSGVSAPLLATSPVARAD